MAETPEDRALLTRIADRLGDEAASKVANASESITSTVAKKIKSITIDPVKSLLTPSGMGGVVALATKSPLAGLGTKMLLEGTGKVAKSFMGVGRIISEEVRGGTEDGLENRPSAADEHLELQQEDHPRRPLQGETKTLDDVWEVLSYLAEINEMQTAILIDEQDARIQSSLKQLEQMREDGRLQEAFMDGLLEGMEEELAASQDILKQLELQEDSGEGLSALEGLGLMGIGKSLMGIGKSLKGILIKLLKGFFTAVKKYFFTAAVFVPLLSGIWDGIQAGWDEYVSGGGVSQILGKAFSRTLSGITDFIGNIFGVNIDVDKLNENFDKIGDSLGRLFGALGNRATKLSEDVVQWWEDFSIEDTWKSFIEKLSTMFSDMKNNVVNWLNDIPLIGKLVTTEAEREKDLTTLQQEEENLIRQVQNLQRQSVDPGEGLLADLTGYTEAERQQDLIDLAKQLQENRIQQNNLKPFRAARGGIFRTATHALIGEAQDELVTPLHRLDDLVVNPAISRTLNLVKQQNENKMLRDQVSGKGGGGGNVIAPVSNTVVTQQQATPFVAPVSRRNSENTFQRSLDRSYTRKPI